MRLIKINNISTLSKPVFCNKNAINVKRNQSSQAYKPKLTIHEYCLQRVKKVDPDHYLCGLMIPNDASRRAFFAIRAFNIEVSTLKDVVRDPNLGKIRLQWWRETIKAIFNNSIPNQPVAKALDEAIKNFTLSKSWFLRVIDRREKEFDGVTIRTVDDLERYTEDTTASLMYLSLEAMGVKNVHADHAASHIAKALGISVLLRATQYHSSQHDCYLPLELLAKHGVTEEELFRGQPSPKLKEVVFDVASVGKVHLDKARSPELKKSVPKEAIPALFPAAIADDFYTRLQKTNFDVWNTELLKRKGITFYKNLLLAKLLNRY